MHICIHYLEREPECGSPEPRVILLHRVVEEELLIGLLPVDVPAEVGRREAVPAHARDVHPVTDVVPRVAPYDVGPALGNL